LKEITDSKSALHINLAANNARASWKRMLPAQRKTITAAIEKKRGEVIDASKMSAE
jgi:hypothetical protein